MKTIEKEEETPEENEQWTWDLKRKEVGRGVTRERTKDKVHILLTQVDSFRIQQRLQRLSLATSMSTQPA